MKISPLTEVMTFARPFQQVIAFAREEISYRHPPEVRELSDKEKILGGEWLELSMKGEPLIDGAADSLEVSR